MSAYTPKFNPPLKCDIGVERQLEIALINAQKGKTDECLDYTRFDTVTLHHDGVYDFKCSRDDIFEYKVIPNELIKFKATQCCNDFSLWVPDALSEAMKPEFDDVPLEVKKKLFKALSEAEVNLIITIQQFIVMFINFNL